MRGCVFIGVTAPDGILQLLFVHQGCIEEVSITKAKRNKIFFHFKSYFIFKRIINQPSFIKTVYVLECYTWQIFIIILYFDWTTFSFFNDYLFGLEPHSSLTLLAPHATDVEGCIPMFFPSHLISFLLKLN